MGKDLFQRFVEVFILCSPLPDITEQLGGQHKKALRVYHLVPNLLRHAVGQLGIIEIFVTGIYFPGIYVGSQIFRDVAIKHGAKNIALEVPAIYAAAQLIRDIPNRTVQLIAFLFSLYVRHGRSPFHCTLYINYNKLTSFGNYPAWSNYCFQYTPFCCKKQ